MSLITRCPACSTMFKVVSDQLKVSQGWVRCGQCADVFDASLHLQTEKPPQPAMPVESVADPVMLDATVPTNESPAPVDPSPVESTHSSYAEDISAALNVSDNIVASAASEDATAPIPQALQDSIYTPDADHEESPADVSFVRDARRQAFWRKPMVRVLLLVGALLLTGMLGLQLAVQQRDRLTSFEPWLKPFFQSVCEIIACTIEPVRQIEAIVIDSSSFNKVDDAVYRLSFAIKNTALIPVAMPSLEITLTDTQDQVVVRRVLTPAQFGMASGLLGASAEFAGAVNLQLTPLETPRDAGNVSRRVAGYRLLAFYP